MARRSATHPVDGQPATPNLLLRPEYTPVTLGRLWMAAFIPHARDCDGGSPASETRPPPAPATGRPRPPPTPLEAPRPAPPAGPGRTPARQRRVPPPESPPRMRPHPASPA